MGTVRRQSTAAAVKPIHSSAPGVEDLGRQVRELQNSNPFAGGVMIDLVLPSPAAVAFRHGLGRVPTGWILADYNAASPEVVVRRAWTDVTITFESAAACTGKVWVF